jgi:hypothetical protein
MFLNDIQYLCVIQYLSVIDVEIFSTNKNIIYI